MAETGKYSYAIGRRKTSSATVRLFKGKGKNEFNGKEFSKVYVNPIHTVRLLSPLKAAELDPNDFYVTIKASGGGRQSQLEAAMLGIARAIVEMDPERKTLLKKHDMMTRDPRMVERKKTGLRKARKAEQFSKR